MPQKRITRFVAIVFSLLLFSLSAFSEPQKTIVDKPLIGILLNDLGSGGYSKYPWYAIRQNYGKVIAQMGGIPVYVGFDTVVTEDYLSVLDGILLTGGEFSMPEEFFTTGMKNPLDPKKYPRTAFEIKIVQQAFEKDIPVLAICGGMQNMNAALGGTLIQSIANTVQSDINHHNEERTQPQHSVQIKSGTKLSKALNNATKLDVNSNHRVGIKILPAALISSANASDGVIEGIEAPDKRFFLGVMWHPEFLLNEQEKGLFKTFLQAAAEYQNEK